VALAQAALIVAFTIGLAKAVGSDLLHGTVPVVLVSTLVWLVLAYLPPTAPFAMPVLVSLGRITPWEFAASAALSVAYTIGVAKLATSIYRRAILRTGRRVRLREAISGVGG